METYIFDLDGTLGIFDEDRILLRPGLQEAFSMLKALGRKVVLASKGSPEHVSGAVELLKNKGADFSQVLSCADVYVKGHSAFKRYDKIVYDPGSTVIVGDLLRGSNGTTTLDYYAGLDLNMDAEGIFENSGLSDNPVPSPRGTPLYVVVPQLDTLKDGKVQSLSLAEVISACENDTFEKVTCPTFAQRSYGAPFAQQYGLLRNFTAHDVEIKTN